MKEYDDLLDSGLTIHAWDYYNIIDDCLEKLTLEHAKFFIKCALSQVDDPKIKFDPFRLLFNLEYFYDKVQDIIKDTKDAKV